MDDEVHELTGPARDDVFTWLDDEFRVQLPEGWFTSSMYHKHLTEKGVRIGRSTVQARLKQMREDGKLGCGKFRTPPHYHKQLIYWPIDD